MITKPLQKIKSFIEENKSDIYIATIIFLVSLASFGLGRLSVLWPKKEPITITGTDRKSQAANNEENGLNESSASLISKILKGKYVGSKSGKAYHFPWCAGALKIKEGNKIWFQTKEEAEKAGYKPAGNCEGL